jgi:hypothetical protein
MTKIRLVHIEGPMDPRGWPLTDGKYVSTDGHTIERESTGETPNGNRFAGRWVLRDQNGDYLDHDQYRHDLMERHHFDDNAITLAEYLAEEFA